MFRAAAKIDSDYERSQTLQVLLQQPNLSREAARTALKAAAQMSSDY